MVDIVFFMPRFFCKRVTSRVVIVNVPVILFLCLIILPLFLGIPTAILHRPVSSHATVSKALVRPSPSVSEWSFTGSIFNAYHAYINAPITQRYQFRRRPSWL